MLRTRLQLVAPLALSITVAGATVGCQPYRRCDPVDEAATDALPERLSLTGLYAPGSTSVLANGVLGFRPRFELWSDGAVKQRWIWLPPGAAIDSRDMDAWQFPIGTKVWKEFVQGGVRVETRLLARQSSGWTGVAYLWKSSGDDAMAAPYGAIDALDTSHDVPAANECAACHGGRSSHVLGFSALQLAQPAAPPAVDLDQLASLGLLTHAPTEEPQVPGSETDQAALGYLHANCSHCHNAARPPRSGARCFDPDSDIDFTLSAAPAAAVTDTAALRTGRGASFEAGDPDGSRLLELMSKRGRFEQMPPLASEQVDTDAVALLRRWIETL